MVKTFLGVGVLAFVAVWVYDATRRGSGAAPIFGTVNGVTTHIFSDVTGA